MITFSKRTDYGLIALSHLAAQEEGEATNAKAIAAAYGIPPELLAKTLQILAKKGIVESRNGPKGGYVLSRRPETISVFDVIQAIEGHVAMANCQVGDASDCDQFAYCPLLRPMERIQHRVVDVLKEMTLLDMSDVPVGEIL
ncbi:MAG: Rrf2 family transcriptional regulator [Nitrospinota bacterium]|jgi:Rrf2 family protein